MISTRTAKMSIGFVAVFLIMLVLAACADDNDVSSAADDQPEVSEAASSNDSESSTDDTDATSTEADGGSASGPLVIGVVTGNEPDHYNYPLRGQSSYHYLYPNLMYRGLTRIDPAQDYAAIPELAERVDVSDDGLIYTAHIREGLLWPDGEPFTAEDVAFTMDLILNPEYAAPSAVEFGLLENVEVLDDLTVVFTLSDPYAPFMNALAFHIAPRHLLEGQDPYEGEYAQERPVGMGPYQLTERRRGEFLVLDVNPHFAGEQPQIDQIIVRFFADSAGLAAALQTNEVHVADLPPALSNTLDEDVYTTATLSSVAPNAIAFNFQHDMFEDPAVRVALNYAIDRDGIIEAAYDGYGSPASGPFPNSLYEDESLEPFTLDLDKVNELMTGAGWELNDDDIWELDGEPFAFTIYAPGFFEDAALLIADDLRRAGFDVDADATKDYAWIFSNFDQAGAVTWTFGAAADPDSTYLGLHSSAWPESGGFNLYYSNAAVDAALDEARRVLDVDDRMRLYAEAQAAMHEDPPYLFVLAAEFVVAVDQRVGGWSDDLVAHGGALGPFTASIELWTLDD